MSFFNVNYPNRAKVRSFGQRKTEFCTKSFTCKIFLFCFSIDFSSLCSFIRCLVSDMQQSFRRCRQAFCRSLGKKVLRQDSYSYPYFSASNLNRLKRLKNNFYKGGRVETECTDCESIHICQDLTPLIPKRNIKTVTFPP